MAKQVRQLRYYGEENSNNYPSTISAETLATGEIFAPTMPSSHIGIQSLPGTKFRINGNATLREIMLGHTGIYELELGDDLSIDSLQFNMASLVEINNNENAALFIDIIYEGGDV